MYGMRRVLAYISLALAAWSFAGGVLVLIWGMWFRFTSIPQFWIPLVLNFAVSIFFAALVVPEDSTASISRKHADQTSST
jgi:peptidoglycan/LPS O-acetylase OafA/YrhL